LVLWVFGFWGWFRGLGGGLFWFVFFVGGGFFFFFGFVGGGGVGGWGCFWLGVVLGGVGFVVGVVFFGGGVFFFFGGVVWGGFFFGFFGGFVLVGGVCGFFFFFGLLVSWVWGGWGVWGGLVGVPRSSGSFPFSRSSPPTVCVLGTAVLPTSLAALFTFFDPYRRLDPFSAGSVSLFFFPLLLSFVSSPVSDIGV